MKEIVEYIMWIIIAALVLIGLAGMASIIGAYILGPL